MPHIDETLRSALTHICNVPLSDQHWLQASLPVRYGGLGIRSVSMLASSAFLASAAGTQTLQTLILQKCHITTDESSSRSLARWNSLAGSQAPVNLQESCQRTWDTAVTEHVFKSLLNSQPDSTDRARLLAAAAPHSGDWLHAMPITACGLRLNNEAVRVAVSLRLGTELCQVHQCCCGATVNKRGLHVLSCKRNSGRSQRHHYLNDLVWRAMSRAGIPSLKEPHGLARSDGKRPDGLTLIPWREGRSATWDVTVTDTVATSYVAISSTNAASAAEAAAQRKASKYADIARTHLFFPLAFETMGPMNVTGQDFLSEIGHRITSITEDPRETSFLFQRLSIALQRFNSICLSNSFCLDNTDLTTRWKHT